MTDDLPTPAQLADAAAETVRSVNHATLPDAGRLTGPGDVYDVAASLRLLASRLPQAVIQLDSFLTDQVENGRVTITDGQYRGDPQAAAAVVSWALEEASAAAHWLADALDHAQQALVHAARHNPDPAIPS